MVLDAPAVLVGIDHNGREQRDDAATGAAIVHLLFELLLE